MFELWNYSFFRYSIGISIILSFLFALISFIIVIRRLSFLAVGTEHAAFGGAGLARILGWDSFLTTALFCMGLTIFAGQSHKKDRVSSDMGTSLVFSGSMALGLILLSKTSVSSFNLTAFLFGDLIGVTKFDLIFALCVTITILVILLPALGKILYLSFDYESALVSGTKINLWDILVYASLSISIILAIKLVGVLLVAAMTVLPASFAFLWHKKIYTTLWIAFFFTLFSMISGILLSLYFDIPPGALIVAVSVLVYFFTKLIINRNNQ